MNHDKSISWKVRNLLMGLRVALVIFVVMHFLPLYVTAQGYSPEEATQRMTVAEGFTVELVASEPLVRQPVAIDFDDRGRLWVMQYLQYPNPAGLKRVKVDRYSRTTYDRVPRPPPHGPKGADRLTILEDTDGDGRADTAKDFVSGLNLATGFTFGYGGVFVLQAPYLLFYPDHNHDDVPDGDPEVLLQGFGMEDSSSLVNSLVWGPDGWLYGSQGTNITADIRGTKFEQALWRYHPTTKKFELFMEGGSNMWGLDFDRKGNLLAGTNYGGYLMFHGVQGAYYQKSFTKHGELHNPFAFGYFPHVPHENFQGGHVTVGGFIYQGNAFPPQFRDKYMAVDTLGHAVRWHSVKATGSTFRTENGGVLLQANDPWFAPTDSVMGPDGAVYIADWYDRRTAHPDPDASWDKSNGRIYRLRWEAAKPEKHSDPQSLPGDQLVDWIGSPNEWKVRRARRILAERGDHTVIGPLTEILRQGDDHQALQALWTLHSAGGLNDEQTEKLLDHKNPSIRAWTIRLLADDPAKTERSSFKIVFLPKLVAMAKSDDSPVVIRQLASTAQRLSSDDGISLARALAERNEFGEDPYIPLLIWWAVEHHSIAGRENVLRAFANPGAWKIPLTRDVILGRLMRRYAGEGSKDGFAACARLLTAAPDDLQRKRMIAELDAGLKMLGRKKLPGLPLPESELAIKRPQSRDEANRLEAIPAELAGALAGVWSDATSDPDVIRLFTRLGSKDAQGRALALASDESAAEKLRLLMLEILQELGDSSCVGSALQLVLHSEAETIRLSALKLLSRFPDERITSELLAVYPGMNGSLRVRARDLLLGRVASALLFLNEIDHGTYSPDEVTTDQLRIVALHNDERLNALVRKHWGNIRAGTSEEKLAEIRRLSNDLQAGEGNMEGGKLVFAEKCAACHKLFGVGNQIGPDLTEANRKDKNFLLLSLVDPSAQIRKEYLLHIVTTKDGRVASGSLVEDNAASITLLDVANQQTSIARDDIDNMITSPVSLMPEGILKQLNPQQVRDLFRYLQHSAQ